MKHLIDALRPILQRVRTDVTAVRKASGEMAWTKQPLTHELLIKHLGEGPARGVCPIKAGESTCRLALLDFDSHGGETVWDDMVAAASAVMAELRMWGYQPVPWRSRGGRGLHVFLIWDNEQDAASVRAFLTEVLATCGFSNGTKGVAAGQVEVFPKQDSVEADGFGNQFILPLAGASVPLDEVLGEPMERDDAVGLEWRVSPDVPLVVSSRAVVPVATVGMETFEDALRSLENDLSYDEWRNVIFAIHHVTHGSEHGRKLAHEFSKRSPKYDPKFLDERVWRYVRSERERAVTGATVLRMARERGWVEDVSDEFDDDVDSSVIELLKAKDSKRDDRREKLSRVKTMIVDASDSVELLDVVVREARVVLKHHPEFFAEIAGGIRARHKELTGVPLGSADLKRVLRAEQKKRRYALTEFGNTERMIDEYGSGIRYVPETATWLAWRETHWEPVTEVEIEHRAKLTVQNLDKDRPDGDLSEFFAWCAASQRAVMVKNMVRLASSDPRIVVPASRLDSKNTLLACRNGVVDLTTGALLAAEPEQYITRICDTHYDPEAKCPLFERTLMTSFSGDAELVAFVKRVLGYTLLGKPDEDIMLIPYGLGSNGKSTIFGAVRALLGSYALSASAETFVSTGGTSNAGGAREDLVRLRGARFVYVNEPDEGSELREGAVKSMAGGDAISARGLYARSSVEIVPTWTVIMPTNHKPIIKGSDHGIWRRVVLIPFLRRFEGAEKIADLDTKIIPEYPGVLALLVKACLEYQKTGLRPPASVSAAREEYKSQMDLLSEWLETECEFGADYSEPMQSLWVSWEEFARSRGLTRYISNSTALGRRLDSRFPTVKGSRGVRIRMGIRVRSHIME